MKKTTLFIDAEEKKDLLKKADIELEKIGYLQSNTNKSGIVLIDKPSWRRKLADFRCARL